MILKTILSKILKYCTYIRFNFWDFIIAGTIIFLLFVLFNLLYNPNFQYNPPNIKRMKVNNVDKVCINSFCREFKKPTSVYFYIKKIGKTYVIQLKRRNP